MDLRWHPVVVPPKHAYTSVPSRVLQRKCACGNHTTGGGECSECGKKSRLQTKLKINEPGDVYEREADRIADQLMSERGRPLAGDAARHVQRFSQSSNASLDAAPPSVDRALQDSGRPLEPGLRRDMEERFGYDFSHVRVHSDAVAVQSAQDVNAHAYTVASDIVFGAGGFDPATRQGRRLIAHELTHVVQQAGSGGAAPSAGGRLQRDDASPAPVSMDLTKSTTASANEPTSGCDSKRRVAYGSTSSSSAICR